MTEINNETAIKELENIIGECDAQITLLLTQVGELKKKRKEAEDKLRTKTDSEKKVDTALKTTKTKAETLRDKIKLAQETLKSEIEIPPK